ERNYQKMTTFLSPTNTIRIFQRVSSSTRYIISIREAIFLTKNRNLGLMLPSPNPKSYLHVLSSKYANNNIINLKFMKENSYIGIKNLENFRGISTLSIRAFPPSTELTKYQPNI